MRGVPHEAVLLGGHPGAAVGHLHAPVRRDAPRRGPPGEWTSPDASTSTWMGRAAMQWVLCRCGRATPSSGPGTTLRRRRSSRWSGTRLQRPRVCRAQRARCIHGAGALGAGKDPLRTQGVLVASRDDYPKYDVILLRLENSFQFGENINAIALAPPTHAVGGLGSARSAPRGKRQPRRTTK